MSREDKPGLRARAVSRGTDPLDEMSPDERRRDVRRATFKAGEILLDDGRKIPCIVRNISESGCLIKLDNADALPDFVTIRIELDAPARAAEIVWRSASLAGAMFIRNFS
ncbi:MAG: PilZ domain-containing protein [Parvularculaceae bacterium]|nr:PilZ domain-containing protein [Parvularculaceae bacterium]